MKKLCHYISEYMGVLVLATALLAPFLTPLLTWALAGKSVNVDVVSMFLSILWVVIIISANADKLLAGAACGTIFLAEPSPIFIEK